MQCPKCDNHALSPTKLEHGLPAMSCKKCGGILLSILSYRDWLEGQPVFTKQQETAAPIKISNTKHVIKCTKCRKLMTKYRVAAEIENQIDLCLDCADVWFDDGEWNLLGQMGLQDHFTVVFNSPWQNKIKAEQSQHKYLDELKEHLGDDNYAKTLEFKNWIEGHEYKEDILHFLRKEMLE